MSLNFMLLSQKEIGKLENLRPLLKKARKNNCNTEIYKHEKKKSSDGSPPDLHGLMGTIK